MKLWILMGVVVCSFLLIGATDVYACSCAHPGSPAEAIERSDMVFVGIMTGDTIYPFSGSKDISSDSEDLLKDSFPIRMTHSFFVVQQGVKGVSNGEIITIESETTTSCGYEYSTGLQYVIYGSYVNGNKNVISAGMCTRTAPVLTKLEDLPYTTAQEDLKYFATLNQSYDSIKKTQPMINARTSSLGYDYIILVVVGLLALVGGVYAIRKMK